MNFRQLCQRPRPLGGAPRMGEGREVILFYSGCPGLEAAKRYTTESRRDEGNNFACQEFVMKAKRSCERAKKIWRIMVKACYASDGDGDGLKPFPTLTFSLIHTLSFSLLIAATFVGAISCPEQNIKAAADSQCKC